MIIKTASQLFLSAILLTFSFYAQAFLIVDTREHRWQYISHSGYHWPSQIDGSALTRSMQSAYGRSSFGHRVHNQLTVPNPRFSSAGGASVSQRSSYSEIAAMLQRLHQTLVNTHRGQSEGACIYGQCPPAPDRPVSVAEPETWLIILLGLVSLGAIRLKG